MNSNGQKRGSAGETILWMIITAATVFVVTSFQHTKMALGNDQYVASEARFKKLEKVLSVLDEEFLFEYDEETLEEAAIRGLLDGLEEPYTSYFNVDETKEFLTETEGEYEGVGMYLSVDTVKNLPIVLLPIKNSPAEEAGILPGDYILEIDGKDVTAASLEEVAASVKGEADSTVTVKFRRYSSETEYTEFEKTLKRRKVELYPFEYEVMNDNIAYIKFESFDEKAADNFEKALKEMSKTNDIKGLIIDVRNNPGGLLTTAGEIIDSLLPNGVITYTVDKKGEKDYMYSDSKALNLPIVVITNENSASASEIMAAAIQDSANGCTVGTTTYGKGLVQKFKSLGDGTYIKLTIAEYFSPKGNKINEIGVIPNHEVLDNTETEVDEQLEKALEVIANMI
jgi:carboxyl-terminal processing protease